MILAIATMTKNQGGRLKEWINYHVKLGFNKFIIYLDNCTDNSYEILSNITEVDIIIHKTSDLDVSHQDSDWISRSHRMYNHTLRNYSHCDWIGFIEVDEFIFPQKEDVNVVEFLSNINSDCLYINSWDFKGPFDEEQPILCQSNLVWSDDQRFNSSYRYRGKSIINPKKFSYCVDAHHFSYIDRVSDEFKQNRDNILQIFYGNEVCIDDMLLRIYHFRNHTPNDMNDYIKIKI